MVGGEKASNASTGGLSHTEVRLPKLELPIFEGEVVQWPAFGANLRRWWTILNSLM